MAVILRESEPDYAAKLGLPGPRQKTEARRASIRAFNIGDIENIPSVKVSREDALGLIRERGDESGDATCNPYVTERKEVD